MLLFSFFLSVLALWTQSTLYPFLPLLPFSPFLALASLSRPLNIALIGSFAAGIGMDLLSNDPIGLHTLTYTLTTLAIYRLKNLFSADEPLQLSLYTALLSFIATLFQIGLLFLFDRRIPFCGRWWMSDCIALPFIDAVYTLIWFTVPLYFFRLSKKYWMVYCLKRKNPSLT